MYLVKLFSPRIELVQTPPGKLWHRYGICCLVNKRNSRWSRILDVCCRVKSRLVVNENSLTSKDILNLY
jgi:hypothetical protein